jgi:hypothetical protein
MDWRDWLLIGGAAVLFATIAWKCYGQASDADRREAALEALNALD